LAGNLEIAGGAYFDSANGSRASTSGLPNRLIAVMDAPEVAAAVDRLKSGFGLKVLK
jgi:hypothetical protein